MDRELHRLTGFDLRSPHVRGDGPVWYYAPDAARP